MNNKFTIVLNANNPHYIIPIDKKVKDILYFADFNLFLQQIEKVYSVSSGFFNFRQVSKELIWREFTKDIHRCDLYINGVIYKDPIKVLSLLIDFYDIDTVYRTLMFSTPDSLGLACEILHKVFADSEKERLYVVEPKESKRYYKIYLTVKKDTINFVFDKNMRIIDENGNSKYYVYIKIEFDILNDTQVFINYQVKKVIHK